MTIDAGNFWQSYFSLYLAIKAESKCWNWESHSNIFLEKYFVSAIATHFLQVCSFLFTRRNRLCTSSFNVKGLTTAPLNFVGQFMLDFKESWQWLDNRGKIFKCLFYILKAANVILAAEFWVWYGISFLYFQIKRNCRQALLQY